MGRSLHFNGISNFTERASPGLTPRGTSAPRRLSLRPSLRLSLRLRVSMPLYLRVSTSLCLRPCLHTSLPNTL